MRGRLVSLKEGFIVLGILCGFAASALAELWVPNAAERWRLIWVGAIPLSLLLLGGMWAMPPSPRWLLLRAAGAKRKGEYEQSTTLRAAALASLTKFRRGVETAEVESEIVEIEHAVSEDVGIEAGGEEGGEGGIAAVAGDGRGGESCSTSCEVAMRRRLTGAGFAEWWQTRYALVVGLGLVSLQQLTGQPSVLYFQESIFRDAGFGDSAARASVIVGAAKLVATLTTVATVDQFGRRPLLLVGITLMLGALLLLAAAVAYGSVDPLTQKLVLHPGWPPVVIGALVIYVCGYQVGFGPVTWLLISEIFPLKLRTNALALAVVANFALNLLVALTLEPLQDAFDSLQTGKGQAYLYCTYAVLCVVSLFFVGFLVPETKGRSLEEIENIMLRKAD